MKPNEKFKKKIFEKRIGAIGVKTAQRIEAHGGIPAFVAVQETLEGMIAALEQEKIKFLLWPRSALSRPLLTQWLQEQQTAYFAPPFYDTLPCFPSPLPDLEQFDELLFTSPSTVDAFLAAYGQFPPGKLCRAIGPITAAHIRTKQMRLWKFPG